MVTLFCTIFVLWAIEYNKSELFPWLLLLNWTELNSMNPKNVHHELWTFNFNIYKKWCFPDVLSLLFNNLLESFICRISIYHILCGAFLLHFLKLFALLLIPVNQGWVCSSFHIKRSLKIKPTNFEQQNGVFAFMYNQAEHILPTEQDFCVSPHSL